MASDKAEQPAMRSDPAARRTVGHAAQAAPVSEPRPNTIPSHAPAMQDQPPTQQPVQGESGSPGKGRPPEEPPLTAVAAGAAIAPPGAGSEAGAPQPVPAASSSPPRASIAEDSGAKTVRKGTEDERRSVAFKEPELATTSAEDLAGTLALPGSFLMASNTPPPGTVLTSQDIVNQAKQRTAEQRSIDAQIGLAAYRLGPHGIGEEQHAAAAGVAQSRDLAMFQGPDAPRGGVDTVADFSKLQPVEVKSAVLVVDAVAMVELSKRQQQANRDAAQPNLAAAPADSAQARNEALNRIGDFSQPASIQPTLQTASAAAAEGAADKSDQRALPAGKEGTSKAVEAKSNDAKPGVMVAASTLAAPDNARGTDPARALGTDSNSQVSRLLDKVVQEARWLIRSNQQEVTLRLEPEHLGQMKLKVRHSGGEMTVEMTVDNAAAKTLLDANIVDLRQRLQQDHMGNNSQVQVDVRHGGDSEFARQFTRPGAATAPATAAHTAELPDEAGAPRAARDASNMSIYA
jgi:hypothetical protein